MYEEVNQEYLKETYEDVITIGAEQTFQSREFPEAAYIEYVSSELVVLEQYNSPHHKGYQYVYKDLLTTADQYEVDLFVPEKESNFLVLYFPVENVLFENKIFYSSLGFFIVILLLILIWYAKLTSIQIIYPIQELLRGVEHISKGNFETTIHSKANRELDELKDGINAMALKIGKEVKLKEHSELLRQQLILDISHDLKTPLANIQGYAETLSYLIDISMEDRQKFIQIIRSNSLRANDLIEDLFELSRLDLDSSEFQLTKHDINEWFRLVISSFIDEFEEKKIRYDIDIPEDNPVVAKINPKSLERAITNLINNSILYSNKYIALSLKTEETNLIIKIEDRGIGIPEQYNEKIFDPFIRLDSSRNSKAGGSGLGLAITKKIIDKHNGTISLDSTYKEGSRFIIRLPI
ncbi:HAMP domain-containing sensor histidine kinase [Bacillus spongiae]|uniref:histidine kinase n=1 Tax=Bacillus spongiae TaxID=2683610 RepID=A0ABU8HKV6_9BACI